VAGIYGANAAGKSTVLAALSFLSTAVRFSATAWNEKPGFPHEPFMLDEVSRSRPSAVKPYS